MTPVGFLRRVREMSQKRALSALSTAAIACLAAGAFASCSSSGAVSSSTSSSSTSSSGASSSGIIPDGGPTDAPPDGPDGGASPCTVVSKGTSGLVLAGTLLLPTAPLVGELFVDGTGKIACAAASCSTTAGYASATRVSCAGAVISPGLVNAHDHTDYDWVAPIPHGMTRWDHRNGWRRGTGGETQLQTPSYTNDLNLLAGAELRMVLGGATSVLGEGGVGGLARNLAATYGGALEGLTGPVANFDTFPLGDGSTGVELTAGCAYPSPISPASAFTGFGAYAPHVAEGINLAAENEFACVSGSLGLLTAQTSIIHGVGLSAKDINAIAQAKARVIWSPRSNVSLYGNTASVTVMKNLGVTMALGTDWIESGSMNMLRELSCADYLNQSYFGSPFTDQDLWLMATQNGAVASGFPTQIGALQAGFEADVAVFSGATGDYRAVIDAGVEDVRLVLRGGKVLYGDAELVSAIATSCADLDVCGIAKQVCVDTPTVTLASIQAKTAGVYPLFFCKGTAPTDEPTCVPYRSTYPNGETATDADGDGLASAMDDCATVFNPIRPMDGTTQSDVDGDGVGDACDAQPLNPNAH
jgi:cytosine/adenosine deaminase-related metal-dependent hydrolase